LGPIQRQFLERDCVPFVRDGIDDQQRFTRNLRPAGSRERLALTGNDLCHPAEEL
jgi:hypothetical protein